MKDPVGMLVAYLEGNVGAGVHVFGTKAPDGFNPTDQGCVVVQGWAGDSHTEIRALNKPRVQVRTWAGRDQSALARAIYCAVYGMLHGINNVAVASYGKILASSEAVGGQDLEDPETGFASVISYYEIQHLDTDMGS